MSDDKFTTTAFIHGQAVSVSESMNPREKAEAIVRCATVARFDHNGFPYAVVEIPILIDTIETWLKQDTQH